MKINLYTINFTKKLSLDNVHFICWLVGFLDAEGSFNTNLVIKISDNKKKIYYNMYHRIMVVLSIKDEKLLKILQKALDIGKIYLYEDNNNIKSARLIFNINSKSFWLFEKIFSEYPLLTNHQATRYEYIRERYLNKPQVNSEDEFDNFKTSINIKTKTDIKNILKTVKKTEYFDYWLTGFLNGEVSFTFSKKSGRKAIPIIFLEHTDKDIMYYIKEHLNLGPSVLERTRKNEEKGGLRKTTYILSISSKKDLNTINTLLSKTDFLLGNKKLQYDEWLKVYF